MKLQRVQNDKGKSSGRKEGHEKQERIEIRLFRKKSCCPSMPATREVALSSQNKTLH